jgi:hypothetical protein
MMAGKRISNEVIALKLDDLIDIIKEHVKKDESNFAEIAKAIGGDADKPGIKGRLIAMEQIEDGRKWHIRALWTSALGLIVSQFFNLKP